MKKKAPKVQLMWAVVRDGEFCGIYHTRVAARFWRDRGDSVVRVEVKVIK